VDRLIAAETATRAIRLADGGAASFNIARRLTRGWVRSAQWTFPIGSFVDAAARPTAYPVVSRVNFIVFGVCE
jgi:hypothetical protein